MGGAPEFWMAKMATIIITKKATQKKTCILFGSLFLFAPSLPLTPSIKGEGGVNEWPRLIRIRKVGIEDLGQHLIDHLLNPCRCGPCHRDLLLGLHISRINFSLLFHSPMNGEPD